MVQMQTKMLVAAALAALAAPSGAYPVYGTKRYGRSASWASQRRPANRYESYPYSQLPEEYYPQETYPVYYPPARTSKYEVYQAVLPYYYGDRYLAPPYAYYDPEEALQEAEREEREEAQPIGHELLYEDQAEDLDDVNAAFLQNLIVSQMYREALERQGYYDDYAEAQPRRQEDEDVRELQQLKGQPKTEDVHWFQRGAFRNQEKRAGKTTVAPPTTPPPPGQKEEVLARPATPVRRPFASPVLEMMSKERKRAPSVYDTIKHMLDVEKSLEGVRPHMQKRIVSSEESLARQLSVLKKGQ